MASLGGVLADVVGRFGTGGDEDKVVGAMLLWMLFLLFCGKWKNEKNQEIPDFKSRK